MTIRLSASTYTFLWHADLAPALEGIGAAGYKAAELMAAPPHVESGRLSDTADAILATTAAAPVRIASVVPSGLDVNLASPDRAMRDWSLNHYLAVGRLTARIGAPHLVVHPGRRHPFKPAPLADVRDWVLEAVDRIAAELASDGVRPVFENTPTNVLDTAEDCVAVVEAIGGDRIGICYDVANGYMVEDPVRALGVVATHLALVHLSDTTSAKWAHDPIGRGEVDFAAIAAALADVGYRGVAVAETIHRTDIVEGLRGDRHALLAADLVPADTGDRP